MNESTTVYKDVAGGFLTTVPPEKSPKCPLTDEWLNKICYIRTVNIKYKITKSENSLSRQNHLKHISETN